MTRCPKSVCPYRKKLTRRSFMFGVVGADECATLMHGLQPTLPSPLSSIRCDDSDPLTASDMCHMGYCKGLAPSAAPTPAPTSDTAAPSPAPTFTPAPSGEPTPAPTASHSPTAFPSYGFIN